MLRLQGSSLQKLVAQAVVEGTVEVGGAAVRVEYSETLHFVLPVNQQLCLVAINTNQNHILHNRAHIAAEQLVGDAICEELQQERATNSGIFKPQPGKDQ